MEIQVNLVSGDIYRFEMPTDKPLEFVNKLRPTEIFERPLHQFLGKLCTVSINPQVIEWIEIDTSEFPTTPNPQAKGMTIRQLSADTFKEWLNKSKQSLLASMETEVAQNVLIAYSKATFKSGRTLYFEIRAKLETTDDRIKTSQKIFNLPAIFVYGERGGLYILNTKNIAVWQVLPGLRKSVFFSIPAELVGTQKAALIGGPACTE